MHNNRRYRLADKVRHYTKDVANPNHTPDQSQYRVAFLLGVDKAKEKYSALDNLRESEQLNMLRSSQKYLANKPTRSAEQSGAKQAELAVINDRIRRLQYGGSEK